VLCVGGDAKTVTVDLTASVWEAAMACCSHEHPHHALGAAVGKITMHNVCVDVMLLLVGLGLGRATHVHTFAGMSEESAARAHTWAARQTPALWWHFSSPPTPTLPSDG